MTASTGTPLIRLQDAGVCYGRRGLFRQPPGRWVLRHLSFDLHKGESLGVIGRNGTGKSTLLRLMARIIRPDEGRVIMQKGKRASLLSLRTGFLPHLSGRENIFLSAMLQGLEYGEVSEKLEDIIRFSELGDEIHNRLATYSDGMTARLGFAISMHIDPDVLLVDEVLGVGDARFRQKSADALKARIRSEQTVVLVSHNPDTIRDLCTRAIWIDKGIVCAEGDVDAVLQAYAEAQAEYDAAAS